MTTLIGASGVVFKASRFGPGYGSAHCQITVLIYIFQDTENTMVKGEPG